MIPLVVHLVAAALGVAVAGPMGGVIGGFVGRVIGSQTEKALADSTKRLGEKLSETLLGDLSASLVERFAGPIPNLSWVYRESLRKSLSVIGDEQKDILGTFSDWFDNWDRALAHEELPEIEGLTAKAGDIDFAVLFSKALVRIDAQGSALAGGALVLHDRTMPPELFAQIKTTLPSNFHKVFNNLISDEKYDTAWRELDLEQKATILDTLTRLEIGVSKAIEGIQQLTDQTPIIIEQNEKLMEGNEILQQHLAELRQQNAQLQEQIFELGSIQDRLLMAIKDLTVPQPATWELGMGQTGVFLWNAWQGVLALPEHFGNLLGPTGAAIAGGAIAISDATMGTILNIQNGLGWLPPHGIGAISPPNPLPEASSKS